ncbi:MAG: VWA domain-containing protein [Candidatus Yanofskybacteria bacterium]|nr:VWA domain-containing protein [Candidatus Yanofskybacteria bacterium]
MPDIKGWTDSLHFADSSYFILFNLVWIAAVILAVVLALKMRYRPPRPRFSKFKFLGEDWAWVSAILICAVGITALAGPRISDGLILSQSGGIDVMVWMDNSYSMRGDDIKPSRQEAVKKAAISLAEKGILKAGDRVTLFVFGDITRWRMPFSEDLNDFSAKISEISHPEVYEEDVQLYTDFGYLLEYVTRCIEKQDAFFKKSRWKLGLNQYSNNRIAFLMSDGNNESVRKLDVGVRELQKKYIKVFAVGAGTKSGAEIKVLAYNASDDTKPPVKVTIKSKLEMENLDKISSTTGGDSFVFDSESKAHALEGFMRDAINSNRSSLPRLVYSDKARDLWWELLALLALPLILLALLKLA